MEGATHRCRPERVNDGDTAERVPFLPFIKVPAATITFRGEAQILEVGDIPVSVFERLPRGRESDPSVLDRTAIIRIVPRGEFVTYGIAMPITQMRKHEEAHGRARQLAPTRCTSRNSSEAAIDLQRAPPKRGLCTAGASAWRTKASNPQPSVL